MTGLIVGGNGVAGNGEGGFSPFQGRLEGVFKGLGPFLPEPAGRVGPGEVEIMVVIDPVWKGLCSFWLELFVEEGRLLQQADDSRECLARYRVVQDDRGAVGRFMWRILEQKFGGVLEDSRRQHHWKEKEVRLGWTVVGCGIPKVPSRIIIAPRYVGEEF